MRYYLVFLLLFGCASIYAAPASFAASAVTLASTQPSLMDSSLKVAGALVILFGLLFGSAWLVRRFSFTPSASVAQLRLVSGIMVGQKERVVVVEFRDAWLVLGVTANNISLLSSLPRPEEVASPSLPIPIRFQDLARHLRR